MVQMLRTPKCDIFITPTEVDDILNIKSYLPQIVQGEYGFCAKQEIDG